MMCIHQFLAVNNAFDLVNNVSREIPKVIFVRISLGLWKTRIYKNERVSFKTCISPVAFLLYFCT